MKQYVIDELRPDDHLKLKQYLDENFSAGALDELYWIPIEETRLNDVQKAHAECRPFYFAVELTQDALRCELLVRTRNRLRCECIGYANEDQRNWIVRVVDTIFEKLELIS